MNFLEYYKKTDYNSMKQTILHDIVKHIELEAHLIYGILKLLIV